MRAEDIVGGVRLTGIEHFDLKHTFFSGQCFRWDKNDDGSFTGIAHGRVLKIRECESGFELLNTNLGEYKNIWKNYFDFARDYEAIKAELSKDEVLKEAMLYGWGIRILNQDTWECLISFIISQSNNIPRIKGIISTFCKEFGQPISMDGQVFYSFPLPENLRGLTEQDLVPLRAGYRAKYIVDAVNKVNDGVVNLERLRHIDLDNARKELMLINGVGRKVSDCVLLYGAGRIEVFPVDVWIGRAMNGLYPEHCERCDGDICKTGKIVFGEYCGLAQQYIFYYAREKSLFKGYI